MNITTLKDLTKIQHQIDPNDSSLIKKFERKIPVSTSYILASLQYQTKIANYHLQAMEMCLSLFNMTSSTTMNIISNLDRELISLLWMPIEFAGDYNTQKMALRLIVKVLKHISEPDRQARLPMLQTSQDIQDLLFKLVEKNDTHFERVSRELLNKFNMETTQNCAVFSVCCKAVQFGSFKLFQPVDTDEFWIDFNYTSKSVSFLCSLEKDTIQQEQLSITIKIDQLQMQNQFDCIVVSTEPAQFSADVSEEFENARIAIFTLTPNEIDRLKANKDLLDFYNSSIGQLDSGTNQSPNLHTIEDNLLQDVQMQEIQPLIQVLDPDQRTDTVDQNILTKQDSCLGNMEKSIGYTEDSNISQQISPASVADISKGSQKRLARINNKQKKNAKSPPNAKKSNKESGYNTEDTPSKVNQTLFKRPRRSNQLKVKQTPETKKTHILKPPEVFSQKKSSGKRSVCRFKTTATNQRITPSSAANTSNKIPRRKPTKNNSNINGAIATTKTNLQRKQVSSRIHLNHLTKADCDPGEAALEFVENGGYANITSFIRSKTGLACFNEQQRKQILQNIERINEDLERSSNKCLTNNKNGHSDSYSDGDNGAIWKRPASKRKRQKPTKESIQVNNFVPYSKWKTQKKGRVMNNPTADHQKNKSIKKSNSKAPYNTFDQLKISPDSANKAIKSADNPKTSTSVKTSANTDTTSSNPNFQTANSDDDITTANGELSSSDLQCRHEPIAIDLSPVSMPNELSQRKAELDEIQQSTSLTLIKSPIYESDHVMFPSNSIPDNQVPCQMSDIFEDFEDLTEMNVPPKASQLSNPISSSSLSSESEKNSCTLEQPSVTHSHTSLQTIPFDVHTESCPNLDLENSWIIEKYLTDQRLYSKISFGQNDSSPPSESNIAIIQETFRNRASTPRTQNITTNQVFIQNQFVLSTLGKNSYDDYVESPSAKLPLSSKQVPLKDYSQLLPEYMERVMKEKNRLLKQLELNLKTNFFDKYEGLIDEVMKSIADHEKAINETQEQLSFFYKKLENLIQTQRKNRTELEEIYSLLFDRLTTSIPDAADVETAYEEVAGKLRDYADEIGSELWQGFANRVVNSIEDRLKKLVDF